MSTLKEIVDEYEREAREICPHCAEPLGNESSGNQSPDKPEMHHLPCLLPRAERVGNVVHLLHRLSLDELEEVDEGLHQIVQSTKWAMAPMCRRCSECEGKNHHWMENDAGVDCDAPWFMCKHCGLTCHAKDEEAGDPEPDESRLFCACGLYPAAECGVGCKEYPDG